MEHRPEHEELLQRQLLGEADEHQVRERLDACPTCRTELEHLRALDSQLLAAAARAHETLATARFAAGVRDEARVRATLQTALARRRGQGRRRFVILALAASLLLAGWLLRA
jgi:anti-sigma factor RsiW